MARMQRLTKQVRAVVALSRARRNQELAPHGLRLVAREDLRPGDVVLNVHTSQVVMTVDAVLQARARHHLVVLGTGPDGKEARLYGTVVEDTLVAIPGARVDATAPQVRKAAAWASTTGCEGTCPRSTGN